MYASSSLLTSFWATTVSDFKSIFFVSIFNQHQHGIWNAYQVGPKKNSLVGLSNSVSTHSASCATSTKTSC